MQTACFFLALFAILTVAELLHSNLAITVTRYSLASSKAAVGFRIVFLSDLHGREFGAGNDRLIEKIAAEEPDIIALVGDLINSDADDAEVARVCAFIEKAAEIAPVYCGLGNHEADFIEKHDTTLAARFEEAGATVLEREYLDIEINGVPVRIGGYESYYRSPVMDTSDPAQQEERMRFCDDFEDTERFKLLLNHIPTNWLDWNYRDRSPVDLVLSGHYHGGVVRIPILEQGLYAPYAGWFPKYTKGCFEGEAATCILTTGLSGANGWPRFFNPPEIVTVDVQALP